MIKRKIFLRLVDAFLAALLVTVLAKAGWLDEIDLRFSDKFFQRESEKNPDIVVIGIDKVTLNKLGPNSSLLRRDMAKAVSYLNSRTDKRPAVIGIDGLFTGENLVDPEGDKLLADAAVQYGNVVVGSEVDLNDEDISTESADPYASWEKTWSWIGAFPALNSAAATGHINAPNERGRLYSFARVIYEKWYLHKGIAPEPLPETKANGIYYLIFSAKSFSCGNNFLDLLEGKVSPDAFRDKIVLIGSYAPGMQDSFPTSLDRSGLMYGVDVHANAIQAF